VNELDHLNVELSGRNLIEASAGTGKTYAIVCLYLRLLLEKDLTPAQILVVTFTEAATEELRGRIRGRIREALGVFEGADTEDTFLAGLRDNRNGRGPDRAKAMDNLRFALSSFDTASIFTIHGFCLLALQDNAFESGSLYDTGLVTDQSGLLSEMVDDFWRLRFFDEPAPLLGYALRHGYSPEYFTKFLMEIPISPMVDVRPRYGADEIASVENRCGSAYERLREAWIASRGEIENILTGDKGLSRSADNYRIDLIPSLIENMGKFVAGGNRYDLFEGFDKFRASNMERNSLKKFPPPKHPFFDLCEELQVNVEERFLALRWELVQFVRERMPARKRELNIRFFDDLLKDLYAALQGESGEAAAAAIRGKYRAALIDEFQDTDPVQYEIFHRIYSGSDHPFFIIGDPKQAIYSFRGADIFAYMEAAQDVDKERRFTLTGNWRSTPRLLDAFNALFDNEKKPFVFDTIAFHPVRPGREGEGKQLVVEGEDNTPMKVWNMPPDDDGTPPGVSRANEIVPRAVAAEISRLLAAGTEGKAHIDGRPVVPGDIAVLVRDHRQAGYIRESLEELSITSVMRSDRSIFSTDEARDVLLLLGALADPGSGHKVRAALATDILGMSGNDIALLNEDERSWEQCLEKFRFYHNVWLDNGFMVMSGLLTAGEGVRGRLLRYADGERRMTNLLHCFEIIHHAGHEKGLGLESVLNWFGERVAGGEQAEEYQIRLETDEMAVRIVTVHVSKGLEYPVVFCPFMWGGLKGNDGVVSFHDGFRMVKDFGSPDYSRNRVFACREALAENMRLLYVALTRAKQRCYLLAGKIVGKSTKNRPETSPLSYLFHASAETKNAEDLVGRLAEEVGELTSGRIEEQLMQIAARGKGSISVAPMPSAEEAVRLSASDDEEVFTRREFAGIIDRDWRVASFTSFAAHERGAAELPDRDGAEAGAAVPAAAAAGDATTERSIFTFPRGTKAGIFLHGIFENLDFAGTGPDAVDDVVMKGLEKYGYDVEWQPHISAMVNDVVKTPLSSPGGDFTLSGLKKGSWVTELEFFFPLRFITSDVLAGYFRKWAGGYDDTDLLRLCSALRFRPVRGMVRGFMDMVFEHGGKYYLVDWKSNHLGYSVEDYGRGALKREMTRKLYTLQYLLYTVALNRYLSMRVADYDYSTRFGGVIYVFLRGLKPEAGGECGVFRDIPPAAMIGELTDLLIGTGG
jgi:exodeoxyribonuclease V beta subunit